ncbi:MAG TPA: hypothetical protein VF854_02060 [Azonexus sp.]
MHPSSALLVSLIAIVVIQFLGLTGLALVFAVLLAVRSAAARWWQLLRRMRLLLLSVWLILAYGVSGDALFDLVWMPTYEGVLEATLHAARLILMLGSLAWLFNVLGKHGLLVALQSLLHPLSRFGIASERLVVRLSLVMQNLQVELPNGAWRNMLDGGTGPVAGPETLRVEVPPWRAADFLVCLAVLAFSWFAISLG